jgi:hypothetical protein
LAEDLFYLVAAKVLQLAHVSNQWWRQDKSFREAAWESCNRAEIPLLMVQQAAYPIRVCARHARNVWRFSSLPPEATRETGQAAPKIWNRYVDIVISWGSINLNLRQLGNANLGERNG